MNQSKEEKNMAKASTKTTAAKTAETKTAETKPAAKAAAKTAAAEKKPAAKKAAAEKIVTKVQFGGNEYDVDEIVAKAKAAFKAESKAAIKTVNVYIKPEDNAAYYVVNDKAEGKIDL